MKKSIIALLAVVGIFAISSNSYAVPAFARLNGMACSTCHYQQFPMLNAFGRDFKANGYTMVKKEELVEGDKLSIPHDLGVSLVTKIRYQKTNGGDDTEATNNGDLQFPDEAALLLGGRVAENIGFLLEASLIPGEKTVTDSGGDTAKVPETNLYTSFKMPFVYDVAGAKVSVIPFTTDLGASYGFELLNTGAVRNVRVTEHRKDVSAHQYLGTDGDATGIAFVGYNETGYVNYSLWKPVHGSSSASFLNYLRVVATPQVAGWDVGVGAQIWSGTSTDVTTTPNTKEKSDAWAIDAQAQGIVANMPLGVYFTYGSVGKNSTQEKADSKATAIAADLGVLPSTQVTAALRIGDSAGQSDNAITVGARHLLAQNVQLSLNHSIYSGDAYDPAPATGNQLTTLMLFAAF